MQPMSLDSTRLTLTPNNSSVAGAIPEGCGQVRIYNGLTVVVFVESAKSGATASTSCVAMAPGATECFTVPGGHRSIAAYSTGSGSVYISFGPGF
jgi:hypothetical protein